MWKYESNYNITASIVEYFFVQTEIIIEFRCSIHIPILILHIHTKE